jgi:hypothetical protein
MYLAYLILLVCVDGAVLTGETTQISSTRQRKKCILATLINIEVLLHLVILIIS